MRLNNTLIKNRLKIGLGLDASTAKIVVAGLGVTGISVARFLKSLDFNFAVADKREQPAGLDELRQEFSGVKTHTGVFGEDLFCNATHLVVSPGISLNEEAIKNAVRNGVQIVGDIDLFACSVETPIIAITGSNGKSTVTTMVGEMAVAAGKKVGVGGNLGIPALDLLEIDAELYVLELSSFQLERSWHLNATAATVLNVTADHLDRHSDLADYAVQKRRIFAGSGCMIINIDDPVVAAMREESRNILTFSIRQHADFCIGTEQGKEFLMYGEKVLMPLSDLPLEGRHNAANALAALALGMAAGLDSQAMCKALLTFKGLAHRMQRVAEISGVTWVNDSKATNIGACVAALEGYTRKVVLIAGGDAKGADMDELTPSVKAKTKGVVLMGKDAGLIEQALNGCVPVYKATNIKEAVNVAAGIAEAGETVLLSPACASFDQYKNYQDRGDQFTQAVLSLANQSDIKILSALKAAS